MLTHLACSHGDIPELYAVPQEGELQPTEQRDKHETCTEGRTEIQQQKTDDYLVNSSRKEQQQKNQTSH